MQYRFIGSSDLKVSVLGLGTATFGGGNAFFKAWGDTDVGEARRMADVAIEAGVTLFDSADVYSDGLAEEILGKVIVGRRSKMVISTKVGFRTGPGVDDIGTSRKHLQQACEASLRRLGVDTIDLWQLHGFDALTPLEETLSGLDELVRAGKVRYVGCSNFSGWHLMKSLGLANERSWPRHIAHQAHYSLLDRDYEWELMPLAMDQGVGTIVWSPLSGGLLTGKIDRNTVAPIGSRVASLGPGMLSLPSERFHDLIDLLRSIAGDLGRSVSQVALSWLLRRPTVSAAIVGARNVQQLADNLAASDLVLSDEIVQRLDAASASRPAYPYWHQHEYYRERNPTPVEARL